jgi:tetratricopeptide (TPR) repeat protein
VHYKLGNYDTAKVYIEKALTMDGDNHELLDHIGDVLFKLGDKENALIYWKKALEFNKENESIKRKIERGEI